MNKAFLFLLPGAPVGAQLYYAVLASALPAPGTIAIATRQFLTIIKIPWCEAESEASGLPVGAGRPEHESPRDPEGLLTRGISGLYQSLESRVAFLCCLSSIWGLRRMYFTLLAGQV